MTRGHDFSTFEVISGGMKLKLMGHGSGIKKGDYLILPNGADTTRYKVDTVEYFLDPSDMWKIEASFAPRPMPVSQLT